MTAHAKYSPSGAEGWSNCADWTSDSKGSTFADWGTAAHEVAANCLTMGCDAVQFRGTSVTVNDVEYTVDDDMEQCVQNYLDTVRAIDGERFVEQRLPIGHLTGEEGAHGTADCITAADTELIVDDLKTGKGVKVDAPENKQLALYAQAAVDYLSPLYDFTSVRLRIIQPRIYHVSEWCVTVPELAQFVAQIKPATSVVPGVKQCQWCVRKASCAALAAVAEADMSGDVPTDPAALAAKYARISLVEDYCAAVRAEVTRLLADGQSVPGFKLVAGKSGARTWTSAEEAETALRAMRLKVDDIYDRKVISPTSAEKLLKATPKRWAQMQAFITQKSGAPTVVPASDPRQAISLAVSSSEFTPITA